MDLGAIATQVVSSAVIGVLGLIAGLILRHFKKATPPVAYIHLYQPLMPGMPIQPNQPQPFTPNPPSQPYPPYQPYQPDPRGAYVVPGMTPAGVAAYPQPKRPSVNFGWVLIDVAVLQFFGNVIALFIALGVGVIGSSIGVSTADLLGPTYILLYLAGTTVLTIGFFIIGLLVNPAVRWPFLFWVAVGTVIATLLVNFAFGSRASSLGMLVLAFFIALVQTFIAMGIGGGLSMIFRRAKAAAQPANTPAMPVAQRYGQPAPRYPALPPGQPGQPVQPGMPGTQQYPPQQYPPQPNQPQPNQPQYPQHPPV